MNEPGELAGILRIVLLGLAAAGAVVVAATIVVGDRQVSGQHVWLGPREGRIIARDYGSTNGTILNGDLVNRVTELALRDGDVLTLGGEGSVKFVFRKP